jgi:hypothetical protein
LVERSDELAAAARDHGIEPLAQEKSISETTIRERVFSQW